MVLTYRQMQKDDIARLTPLFLEYWNGTGDQWTPELVYRRIWQVLGAPDSYCLIAEHGAQIVAFAIGRMETFSDLTAYDLIEIVVATEFQGRGIGTCLMTELERQVKAQGAAMMQLQSVNDAQHEHFYGKLGYGDAINLKLKTKFL